MKFYAVLSGIAVVALFMLAVANLVETHTLPVLIWRILSGHTLTGVHYTNATWLRNADTVLHPTGRAHRWHHQKRIKRAGIRTGSATVCAVTGYGLATATRATVITLIVAGTGTLAVGIAVTVFLLRRWYNDRVTVIPLSIALAPVLSVTEVQARKAIDLPPTFLTRKQGQLGSIALPAGFKAAPGERAAVEHLVTSRLPVDVSVRWHVSGPPLSAQIHAAPKPPKLVTFASVTDEIRALPQHEILLGVTGSGERKTWDQQADEPHALVAAQTRRGKTSLAMLIMAQTLHKGGSCVAVDPKQVGLDEFLAGHPNAVVHADPQDMENSMWQPVRDFKTLLHSRIAEYKADRTIQFKRALLVVDEVTLWSSMSKNYWDATRPAKTKATPPVFSDLAECLYAGAQFRCNVLIFGQVLGHAVLGNAIESFGLRLLGGYTKQSYARLCGLDPMPRSQKARGRFLIHDGGDIPVWTQTVYGSIQELRDFALEPYKSPALSVAAGTLSPSEVTS